MDVRRLDDLFDDKIEPRGVMRRLQNRGFVECCNRAAAQARCSEGSGLVGEVGVMIW